MPAPLLSSSSLTRRAAVKFATVATCALLSASLFSGCSSSSQEKNDQASEASTAKSLEGKTLDIYCGAGMTDPFQEIVNAFKDETGCEVNVTFANAAQIQTQIKTTEQGDFFIAGSADELKPVESYVETSTDLVKHIPVLAVPADNPKNITGLADLSRADRVLVGDPESTPIGKIAKKALTSAGLWDSLSSANVLSMTTTAPQITTALSNGEGDAGIVWKENVKGDGVKIVETSDLDSLIKTVPAAQLTCAKDSDAVKAFNDYLQTETAQSIWANYGYEAV